VSRSGSSLDDRLEGGEKTGGECSERSKENRVGGAKEAGARNARRQKEKLEPRLRCREEKKENEPVLFLSLQT